MSSSPNAISKIAQQLETLRGVALSKIMETTMNVIENTAPGQYGGALMWSVDQTSVGIRQGGEGFRGVVGQVWSKGRCLMRICLEGMAHPMDRIKKLRNRQVPIAVFRGECVLALSKKVFQIRDESVSDDRDRWTEVNEEQWMEQFKEVVGR